MADLEFTVDEFDRLRPEAVRGNALSLELEDFRNSGGKLIIWHGWSDQAIPPTGTLDYCQRRRSGAGRCADLSAARSPTSGSARDTERTGVPLCDILLHDAEGTEVRWRCRVEQVAVDKAGGAAPDRINQRGDVIDRSAHAVYVRFDHGSQTPIPLRPHLVRVLSAPDVSRSR